MREIFTSGSVGGAPGNWCFYPEESIEAIAPFLTTVGVDTTFLSCIMDGQVSCGLTDLAESEPLLCPSKSITGAVLGAHF